MDGDVTIQILKQIRDGITAMDQRLTSRLDQTNERLDQTNERLDQTNERLDQTNERLDNLTVRMERVERGLLDLGKFMKTIARELTRYERWHAHHVRLIEKDVASLDRRVSRLEKRRKGPA